MEPTGVELARRYAAEIVGPLLSHRFPSLPYAAGRLGTGSEVLGLDDASSRDHDWGLRLTLLLPEAAVERCAEVSAVLEAELPQAAYGLPVRFALTGDARVAHRVEVATLPDFVRSRIGLDPLDGLTTADWLSMTGQAVLEVTAGAVFADHDGALTRTREALRWYPGDLWAVLVAVDWHRLAQELPLAGRAGERGDDLGSRVVSARLVGVAMHLGFLLERRWPPYPKWLGSLFSSLPRAGVVTPDLTAAVGASTWQERQERLGAALEMLQVLQRDVGLPTVTGAALQPFFARPFVVVRDEVEQVLLGSVTDPDVLRAHPAGSVEQWVDAVRVLGPSATRARVSAAVRFDATH